ncbi:YggT family protein [Rothia halotolerans]|uniref:YggT family protein n=1 Tax=Rothia halotolerans TaxID=405770 RepID=UPI00101E217D|nr:YggT family protein [Rothia halotolerans]
MVSILALFNFALYLLLLVLMFRLVLDWVQSFARSWRPKGVALVFASSVYSLTDPPMRLMRRIIPPLNLGGISLDMGFLVLVLGIGLVRAIVGGLMISAG